MYGCHVTLDRFRKSQKDTTLTDIRLSLTLTIKISIFITKKNGGISKIVDFLAENLDCDFRLIDFFEISIFDKNFIQKFQKKKSHLRRFEPLTYRFGVVGFTMSFVKFENVKWRNIRLAWIPPAPYFLTFLVQRPIWVLPFDACRQNNGEKSNFRTKKKLAQTGNNKSSDPSRFSGFN